MAYFTFFSGSYFCSISPESILQCCRSSADNTSSLWSCLHFHTPHLQPCWLDVKRAPGCQDGQSAEHCGPGRCRLQMLPNGLFHCAGVLFRPTLRSYGTFSLDAVCPRNQSLPFTGIAFPAKEGSFWAGHAIIQQGLLKTRKLLGLPCSPSISFPACLYWG